MPCSAQRITLPRFVVTEVTDKNDPHASKILLANGEAYYARPLLMPEESVRRDGKPRWSRTAFNIYPIVLQGDGTPWDEANLWLYKRIEGDPNPIMANIASLAGDLAAFRTFIEEQNLDWRTFPSKKHLKPTYRWRGRLGFLVEHQEIAITTAKRRLSTIIRFYRWLMAEGLLSPENEPWKAREALIPMRGPYGQKGIIKVETTDLAFRVPTQDDPYSGFINDGGKLRPLAVNEQDWLLEALIECGNTEMILIHLFSLVTGARIQTVLTWRVQDAIKSYRGNGELLYLVGYGTGIDTKYNKKMQLHIPTWFYEDLRTYAMSERAIRRRRRAIGGDVGEQYLFLTVRSAPMYVAKADIAFYEASNIRHPKDGSAVRMYMNDYVIPSIKAKHDHRFTYRFHDLRATYGMNIADALMPRMDHADPAERMTYQDILSYIAGRLGHESTETTERYLKYRKNLKIMRAANDGWETRLRNLAKTVLEKVNDKDGIEI